MLVDSSILASTSESKTRSSVESTFGQSPVSTACMVLLTEDNLHKTRLPRMDTNKQGPATLLSCPEKPLKSILKKSSRTRKSSTATKGSSSTKSFRKCVSFSCSSNSRWDAHHSRLSGPQASVPQHLSPNNGPSPGWSTKNLAWSSSANKAAASPRLPRRPLDTEDIPSSPQATLLRLPRRVWSHENLFQHKIDFFMEQTANSKKKMEQQLQQQQQVAAEGDDLSQAIHPHVSKPTDIEELESSLMAMQKFLVALHSVPNNQKLLQKHLDYQTSLQARIIQKQKDKHLHHSVEEDGSDDDDDDMSLNDSDDEEEDLEELLQELPKFQLMGRTMAQAEEEGALVI